MSKSTKELDIENLSNPKEETWLSLDSLNLEIQLHQSLDYEYSNETKVLTATSETLDQIEFVFSNVPYNPPPIKWKDVWIKSKNFYNNLTHRGTLDYTILEYSDGNKFYKGILKFREINGVELFFLFSII